MTSSRPVRAVGGGRPGYVGPMSTYEKEALEAIQAVVDRVAAYQDGATERTVEAELREGFDEAGVEVAPDDVDALASAINEESGDVSAAAVIG